jgi:hypothetical protein
MVDNFLKWKTASCLVLGLGLWTKRKDYLGKEAGGGLKSLEQFSVGGAENSHSRIDLRKELERIQVGMVNVNVDCLDPGGNRVLMVIVALFVMFQNYSKQEL